MGLSGRGKGSRDGSQYVYNLRGCTIPSRVETPDSTFEMPESEDLTQLREMNLQLLRQLRLGQEEIRKSVAWARGAAQQFPKPRNEEGSSLHTPEAWCSKDKETTVPTEPPRQSVPGPAPGTTTGDEVSEQEQKGSSQEPAPEGIVAAIETVQSVSPAKSPSSSQPQGQESKDYRKPNSRPTLSLPSSPEALGLRPMIDPLMFGVQRSSLETEGLGGLRSNLTTQQWQKFKASQVPPWFGSQSITPKLRWLPTSATLPSGQLPYWPYHKDVRVPDESWRMKPYLGYDVIAGLLDTASPVTHKSENYFSELQDFRKANKEECISRYPELEPLDLSSSTRNKQTPDSHQCLHCYRVNQRLFTVPLHPRASCPVCKTSRGQKGPETLDRPAQIRVSVPFSTFLPPHQYPIHRRKSFDASDTMALPRHCMMGWDNIPVPAASSSALSSLDLRTSLDPSAQQTEPLSHSRSSKVSSWSWSDPLLSMSRTTQFQLSNFAERYWSGGRRFPRPAVRAHPVPSPAL
ncbi:migration and invasion-inhibitory protein isoform X2 [Dromiciops gliroides]|uniref:migration and invasion-inhibitory protein isoform X2 n=1 Tax=Dromiciops gliroides TaxID=33562 RepID=UPI001CC79B42|nr:migration and invasion-inhibitory protein isoform X2 [Dromiciops gliroides]